MKIVHVVSNIDLESGGPSYSVTRACEGLHRRGADVCLYTTATDLPTMRCQAEVRRFPIVGSRRIALSPRLKSGLMHAGLGASDVLHSHGLWMLPNIYPGAVKRRSGCKLVISPRGMLASWSLARSSHKKKLAGWLGQSATLMAADCFHATAESEYDDIRRLGFRQPVTVIPNGVDMPEAASCERRKQVLFLSRIHPKKGIETLLEAWSLLPEYLHDWELIICGPGEPAYLDEIRLRIDQSPYRVRYQAPLFDVEKSRLFHESALFVLPTKSENFGIVVAESLAHATPVIVTKGAPWQGVEFHRCGWWIEDSASVLASVLVEALTLAPAQRDAMGRAGQQWMAREFCWDGVADRMLQTYRWLQGQGDVPSCVRTN